MSIAFIGFEPRVWPIGGSRLDRDVYDVSDFPRFEHSMKEVKRAGQTIAGALPWNEESAPTIRKAFLVANNWRDAHAFPMRSIRQQMASHIGHQELVGITAARLKRMQAIRRKLRRVPENLSQIQDLGGCRAILASIADVHRLVSVLRERTMHTIWHEDDYIAKPKNDGYRSQHLIFSFRGKDDTEIYNNRRVEIQIRTRLQHSWATAVEAVGLFRGEDLKGGYGSGEWLRFFKLMSAEFALAENCPLPPDVSERQQRIDEIKELDRKLEAADTLANLSYAVRYTERAVQQPNNLPTYYLIRFDNKRKEVVVEPSWQPKSAVQSYDNAESADNQTGKDNENIVLVEADKLENLKEAYPNYFGDVLLFKMQLGEIVKGKDLKEYIVRPQEVVTPRPKENPDLSWLRRRPRWK